jgi:hypothetical protein
VSATTRVLVAAIQRIWRGLSPTTIEQDLQGQAGADILNAVVGGQMTVAAGAQAYIATAMKAQGGLGMAEATLAAAAFSGYAGDGRPLASLLFLPAIGVRRRLAQGMAAQDAMIGGLADMAMYAATAIADTARASEQAAMTADHQVTSYVRVVKPPACARCILLAGRVYPRETAFERHPRCDCTHAPSGSKEAAEALLLDPQAYFDRLSEAEQNRVFGRAGAEAIVQGADIFQVVNAHRGMRTATVHGRRLQVTSEGITRRGHAGRMLGDFARERGQRYSTSQTPRLMPEEILRIADGRTEQMRLLRRYGYFT